MKRIQTPIEGAFLIELKKYEDNRGYFMETWNKRAFGLPIFVQDNNAISYRGVLRGLHYQIKNYSQGKLVRCVYGSVYDVIVDLRIESPTYAKWYGVKMDKPNLLMWIPPGIAHGFYTLSNISDFQYKVSNYYEPAYEKVLTWNDEFLNISWPFNNEPIMSSRDKLKAKKFVECDKF